MGRVSKDADRGGRHAKTSNARERDSRARSAEDLVCMLVERLTDLAVYAVDPRALILSWNRGAERCTGLTAAEMIGQSMSRLYTPQDLASNVPSRELEDAMSVGRCETTGWRVRKDGSRFWAKVVVTALHEKNEALVGFGVVVQDLT
ncbi:MAG: PAS domain S-box protein, partial [Gemmatimonadaceae bacterium]